MLQYGMVGYRIPQRWRCNDQWVHEVGCWWSKNRASIHLWMNLAILTTCQRLFIAQQLLYRIQPDSNLPKMIMLFSRWSDWSANERSQSYSNYIIDKSNYLVYRYTHIEYLLSTFLISPNLFWCFYKIF
jgi:hypothetical protein